MKTVAFGLILWLLSVIIPIDAHAVSPWQPTVQITGVVRTQVVVGQTVYAAGKFTGPNGQVDILAYDIATGKATNFIHQLNGEAWAITVSPDHRWLIVGGDFTTADTKPHVRLAEFDLTNGSLVSTFTANVDNRVASLATNFSGVYVGGAFLHANGLVRTHLAGFYFTGAITTFHASTNGSVLAIVALSDKLVIGGVFSTESGPPGVTLTSQSIGAIWYSTGGPDGGFLTRSAGFPFAQSDPVGGARGTYSLSTDGTTIYATSFNAVAVNGIRTFEGNWAIRGSDGGLVFMNDCHGDEYGSVAVNGRLYVIGHPHDCTAVGGFTETCWLPCAWHRALTFGLTPSGTNVAYSALEAGAYAYYIGQPKSAYYGFTVEFNAGTATGQSQGAWSVVAGVGSDGHTYLLYGGEFTKVNGISQSGLVRVMI